MSTNVVPECKGLSSRLDFEWANRLVPANCFSNTIAKVFVNSVEDRY